ncbi:hypothetical protein LguiB_030258 [Lonicera macranthoides]
MQFRHLGTEIIVLSLIVFLWPVATQAHNITTILSNFPEFTTFSQYLALTDLASEINRRETITVCTVNNAAMSDLLRKGLSLYAIKNILSLHVILDYYSAKKLHQITNGSVQAATMFQASGSATGSSGIINITNLKGGKVGFEAGDDSEIDAYFVKSVEEIPYKIAVVQISGILVAREAEAPAAQPSQMNLTALMSARGCSVFGDTLLRDPNANKTFLENVVGGLSIFCPLDNAFKAFLPKFNNLSAGDKDSMLEYHGVPVYMSFSMLKSNNGVINTLATDGGNNYLFSVQNDGNQVTLKTKIVTARIMGKLIDRQPLAIFIIDKVLLPLELFKSALPDPAPANSPAPSPMGYSESPLAPSPESSRKHISPSAPEMKDFTTMDSPADSPDDEDYPADMLTNENVGLGMKGGRCITILSFSLLIGFLQLALIFPL